MPSAELVVGLVELQHVGILRGRKGFGRPFPQRNGTVHMTPDQARGPDLQSMYGFMMPDPWMVWVVKPSQTWIETPPLKRRASSFTKSPI